MRKQTFQFSFCILGLFIYLPLVKANYKETLAKVYIHYSKAEYPAALKKLESVKGDKEVRALVHYWNGKVFSKAQEYGKADIEFKKAIKRKLTLKTFIIFMGKHFTLLKI